MAYILSPRVKINEVIGQFVVGDIFSTVAALVTGVLVERSTGSVGLAAIAASASASVVWYIYLLAYNCVWRRESPGQAIHHIIADFGLAEALDSLLLRPVLMYILPGFTHNEVSGLFIAKVVADMVYTMVSLYYQRRRILR